MTTTGIGLGKSLGLLCRKGALAHLSAISAGSMPGAGRPLARTISPNCGGRDRAWAHAVARVHCMCRAGV
jgi:hypothetical protein